MEAELFCRTLVAAPDGAGPPELSVALAHGFTQNSRCWGPFAARLAAAANQVVEVRAVDAPGHGASRYDSDDLAAAGGRIVAAGGQAHWIGYSMGGRMLLHAALTNPQCLDTLVLIGATAGIDDDAERKQRRLRDEQLADRIEEIGTAAFIDEWLATPLFADLGALACREERLANRAEGMASSLRNCGTGTQLPLWGDLTSIDVPTLVIAGTDDQKFTTLGQRLVEAIGDNADFAGVPGGHAVHLENPSDTAAAITRWWAGVRA